MVRAGDSLSACTCCTHPAGRINQSRCEISNYKVGILSQVRFAAAQCGLTILRYITDHAPHLSLSVLARVVSWLGG